MLVRMWRKGKSCALLVRMQIGTVTMENSIECHPKIKIELIQWSNSSTFVYLFQGIKSNNLIYVPRVCCSIIQKSKHEKFKYPLLDKWENYSIYTIEYYSTIKKNEILTFVTTWMVLEGIMLNEINPRKTKTV